MVAMILPNFKEEKLAWKQGYSLVAGLDEVGRGPLAGPVVAAAVAVRQLLSHKLKIPKVNDSKKLSEKKRETMYEILTNHNDIIWGIGIVSEKTIDKINILQATKLAMHEALHNLYSNSDGRQNWSIDSKVDFLLLDGNFTINSTLPQKPIVRGDQKVFSIAAASIIAKVTRDRIMQKMHKKYPHYGFNQHKGYGTKLHLENLHTHGPCKIHRKSFYPVSALEGVAKNGII